MSVGPVGTEVEHAVEARHLEQTTDVAGRSDENEVCALVAQAAVGSRSLRGRRS